MRNKSNTKARIGYCLFSPPTPRLCVLQQTVNLSKTPSIFKVSVIALTLSIGLSIAAFFTSSTYSMRKKDVNKDESHITAKLRSPCFKLNYALLETVRAMFPLISWFKLLISGKPFEMLRDMRPRRHWEVTEVRIFNSRTVIGNWHLLQLTFRYSRLVNWIQNTFFFKCC